MITEKAVYRAMKRCVQSTSIKEALRLILEEQNKVDEEEEQKHKEITNEIGFN